jgi:hypothetical protein
MVEFKLKSIYLKQRELNTLQVKEETTEELVILRIGEPKQETSNYHHFRVPINALVELQYETIEHKDLLRIVFQLDRKNLSIQYYKWNEIDQNYQDAPLQNDIIHSLSFQNILQSISFSGNTHVSYIINPLQRYKNISKKG